MILILTSNPFTKKQPTGWTSSRHSPPRLSTAGSSRDFLLAVSSASIPDGGESGIPLLWLKIIYKKVHKHA